MPLKLYTKLTLSVFRNDNFHKLEHFLYVKDVSDLSLNIKKCMRQDQLFMDKNLGVILSSLYT